jgi:hypothetical protein
MNSTLIETATNKRPRSAAVAPPATIEDFTSAVFLSEGLDPSKADRSLYRKVEAAITAAFRRSQDEGQ